MREVGIGGVVTTIGWLAHKKGDPVQEERVVKTIIERSEVSRETAELAIQMSERFGVVERKDGEIRVKERTIKTVVF